MLNVDYGKTDIREISFNFALEIIELYKELLKHNEFVLSKQLLKSGTSIGANVEESQAAQSKKDFTAKMSIASKEARETLYWLRLIEKSGFTNNNHSIKALVEKSESIINILTKIVKTSMSK